MQSLARTLFAPAIMLMSRLTYIKKFALVTALFAVPLINVTLDSVVDQSSRIKALHIKHLALQRYAELLVVNRLLEEFRDESVLYLFKASPEFREKMELSSQRARQLIGEIASAEPVASNNLLKLNLRNLVSLTQSFSLVSGSAGDSLISVFENADFMVSERYKIGNQLLADGGVFNDSDPLTLRLLSLISNDFQAPLLLMGKGKAIGAYYLDKGYIASTAVVELEQVIQRIELSFSSINQQIDYILRSFEDANRSHEIDIEKLDSLKQMLKLIENSVLLTVEMNADYSDYVEKSNRLLNDFYGFRQQLVDFTLERYGQRIDTVQRQQNYYTLSMGVLLLAAVYLFMGLFLSVENSIAHLTRAVKRVAKGNLEIGVDINTRDELKQLARVFDEMRVQLREREEELVQLTITDGLTSLYNRKHFNHYFRDQIKLANRSGTCLALLLIDIDHFKKLNDSKGHLAGDECLVQLGDMLRKALGRETDRAFRYGGEEFAVVLPCTDGPGAALVANKLTGTIRSSAIMYNNEPIFITVSIGVVSTDVFPDFEADHLIQAADTALYKAKAEGRDKFVVFQPGDR